MCGIAGTINLNPSLEEKVFKSLFHRGPDENGSINYKNVCLYHTRLSIQDVSHGQQPFHYDEFSIVFNGEIYNHFELRDEYLSEIDFQTHADTETLLHLYIKFKEKMFSMLDGMFAFAILDKSKKELFLARDRSGKKPLYIYQKNKQLFFSSELNVMRNALDLEVNDEYISSYLRTGFFFKETTPYQNVEELGAGYFCKINCTTLKIEKNEYFDLLSLYKEPKISSLEEALTQLDEKLHKSVKDRLLSSDLEVGAFLSGGIDSSLVVAIASEYREKLKTFTVKFDGAFDESALAQLTAKQYGTQHTEINISMNLKNDIEKILYNYGEPFMDSSAIPSYYVSQEAKKYVTVILNGDGADELFGGYRRYVPIANNWVKTASLLSCLLKVLPKAHSKKSLYNYAYRLLAMAGKEGLDFYLSATNDIFEDNYTFKGNNTLDRLDEYIKKVHGENITELSKQLYLDFNLILFSDLLVKMDIATMAHSLEGRSPFLSKYLLEFAPRLDDKLKINGKTTKYILRQLSQKYLSSELLNQPKRGFEVPLKKWVENDLKDNIFDALGQNSYSQNYVDKRFIDDLMHKKINVSDEKRAKMLWTMYCLESWYKQ